MKFIVAIAPLLSLALAAATCPHDKEVECITDVNHGNLIMTQHSMCVTRQPKPKEKTNRPTLHA